MSNISSTLRVLLNLIDLAKRSTDDPQKLIEYLDQAEEHVWQLAQNMQSLAK